MKKTNTNPKKHIKIYRTYNTPPKKYLTKGAMGAGMLYIILAIMIITAGAGLLIGNITPSNSPTGNQPVVIVSPQTNSSKNNLQLYTFPGITYTPTPTPSPNPPKPQTPGGGGGGGGGGGNQTPNSGGGGGSSGGPR